MPSFSLGPTSQGFYNSWTLAAGGAKPTAVQSNDGATSDIRADTALSDSYILQDLPAEAATGDTELPTPFKGRFRLTDEWLDQAKREGRQ